MTSLFLLVIFLILLFLIVVLAKYPTANENLQNLANISAIIGLIVTISLLAFPQLRNDDLSENKMPIPPTQIKNEQLPIEIGDGNSFENGLNSLHEDKPTVDSVEVAHGKPTDASSFWRYSSSYSFPPSEVVDGEIKELHCDFGIKQGNSYWLLAQYQTGWVEVDLQNNYLIEEIRWLNTHNGDCLDRTTTSYHIVISTTGSFNGEEVIVSQGRMKVSTSYGFESVKLSEPSYARYVRFYVDDYDGEGGGLNELEVFALVGR